MPSLRQRARTVLAADETLEQANALLERLDATLDQFDATLAEFNATLARFTDALEEFLPVVKKVDEIGSQLERNPALRVPGQVARIAGRAFGGQADDPEPPAK
jgi:ABC-type transporter Mla subunit MlaD